MQTIPLSERGSKYRGKYSAIVDDVDYEYLRSFRWRALVHGSARNRRIYAVRQVTNANGRPADLRMHREIWIRAHGELPVDIEIDHVEHGDYGGLDNRRANLRLADKQSNQANSRAKGSASGFKGVHRCAERWRAQIMVGRRHQHIGYFDDAVAAAKAYDAAAVAAFGAFAHTNFPVAA